MRCEICGKEAGSLFKVRHRDRGRVKICEKCWAEEKERLLPSSGCSCC